MKKMSDIFELPVTGRDMRNLIKEETTYEDDDLIAHAINHVDTLAGALSELVLQVEDFYADSNEPLIHLERATVALAAYRGEK